MVGEAWHPSGQIFSKFLKKAGIQSGQIFLRTSVIPNPDHKIEVGVS